jgi:hypothetical protein
VKYQLKNGSVNDFQIRQRSKCDREFSSNVRQRLAVVAGAQFWRERFTYG